jgi:Protein of unknown function (DUF2934)
MTATHPIMNTPTHDEIAMQARSLWRHRGCPAGCDTEIWLEAELQIDGDRNTKTFTELAKAETAAESMVEYHLSPAVSEQEAIKAALPTQAVPLPQVPPRREPRAKLPRL